MIKGRCTIAIVGLKMLEWAGGDGVASVFANWAMLRRGVGILAISL